MILLIVLVLGSIYAGIATATEAAAFGVVGALAHFRRAAIVDLDDVPRQPDGRDAARTA